MKPLRSIHIEYARVLCLVLLCGLASASNATSRIADAHVRLSGDLPCFAPDQDETGDAPVEVIGLILYDQRSRPPEKIWSLRPALNTHLQLYPDRCLVYGSVPDGMIASGKATPLVTGVIYSVYIDVRPKNPRSPTQSYTRSFCLKHGSSKQVEIKEIEWDNANKRWRDEVCQGRE